MLISLSLSFSFPVFTPSFELPEYVILENEGPVTVCVLVPDGQLERTATVTFSTADLVATGMTQSSIRIPFTLKLFSRVVCFSDSETIFSTFYS